MTDPVDIAINDLQESLDEISNELSFVEGEIEEKAETIKNRRNKLEDEQKRIEQQLTELTDFELDSDEFQEFLDKPYTIVPKGENSVWVIVPRWIPFHVGVLRKQDESYNHFVVNQYVNWIEEVPDEIKSKVGISGEFENVTVADGILELNSEEERDKAWDSLGGRDGGLYRRKGDTQIQLKNDSEFEVIAELIDRGNLPFKPTPIPQEDIRSEPSGVQLREYQTNAWDKFVETGMIGVYWPPGLGKTFFGLYAGERISGNKLVVVPSTTLREQWNDRIDSFCDHPEEWDIETYQYLTRNNNLSEYPDDELALTIFDEAHTLPAKTHSKLATIDTTYRIGLSATPYREDDRTNWIFSLSGFPVGLNWESYLKYDVLEYPDITVFLHRTQHQKRQSVLDLADNPGRTLIFCDGLDEGHKLAEKLDVPFIHGETTNKLETFRDNRVVVSSRVGDEGLSLEDVDRIIEYDFHGSSRRQELQRVGRLMHGDDAKGEHYLLMTDEEYEKFSSRLFSLREKGYDITILRKD